MRTLVPFTLSLVLIGACGGSHGLRARTTTVKSFASSERCAQGPFEITIPATGHRWGEAVELRVKTPRRVKLIAVVETAAPGAGRASEQSALLGGPGTQPDNRRCVVSLDEVAGGPSGDSAAPPPGDTDPPPGSATPPPGDAGPSGGAGVAVVTRPVLVSVPAASGGEVLVRVSWRNPSLDPPVLRAGGSIRIRFWSLVPNDLEGVVFSLRHQNYVPNKGDADFEAYLRRKRDKWRQRQDERARKRARVAARPRVVTRVSVSRRATPEELRANRARLLRDQEKRRRDQAKRQRDRDRRKRDKLRRARLRREYCSTHLSDRDCWGPGGFRVHVAMNARASERATYCESHPNDARCWSRAELYARQTGWRQRSVVVVSRPSGPPPAPRAETRTPKPSINAEWRPGYWYWAAAWAWIAGQWRVPESDITQELTTTAPRLPPAPRAESRPVAPAPHAIWVAGYWQWTGAEFVWIVGSWQFVPTPGARWQSARWKIKVGGAVLLPGRWIRGRRR